MKNWIMAALLFTGLAFAVHAADDQPVDINSADVVALSSLDGIGETRARAIIEYREQNGGFNHVDELVKVSGIGLATLERNRERIRVDAQASTD